jgi:hypothetical protein
MMRVRRCSIESQDPLLVLPYEDRIVRLAWD